MIDAPVRKADEKKQEAKLPLELLMQLYPAGQSVVIRPTGCRRLGSKE
jgi:hypothetical protein